MPALTDIHFSRFHRWARFARYATVFMLMCWFMATHYPIHGVPRPFSHVDKVVHALAYMTLSMSVLVSWELAIGALRPQHYFTVWLVGTLYAAFDEVTQIPVGRSCDGLDWLADIAGIVVGLTLFRLLRPLFYRFALQN